MCGCLPCHTLFCCIHISHAWAAHHVRGSLLTAEATRESHAPVKWSSWAPVKCHVPRVLQPMLSWSCHTHKGSGVLLTFHFTIALLFFNFPHCALLPLAYSTSPFPCHFEYFPILSPHAATWRLIWLCRIWIPSKLADAWLVPVLALLHFTWCAFTFMQRLLAACPHYFFLKKETSLLCKYLMCPPSALFHTHLIPLVVFDHELHSLLQAHEPFVWAWIRQLAI